MISRQSHDAWPLGESEAARLLRSRNWAATPLGAPGDWPERLRGIVDLMLASEEAMFLVVGPDLTLIYNDAFRPFFTAKHPGCFGAPFPLLVPEIWEEVRPLVEATLAGQQQVMSDQHFDMPWRPAAPEGWFTATWTPVRDADGAIYGFLSSFRETTATVAQEAALRASKARQEFLLQLSDALRPLADPVEVQAVASRLLGEHLGASHVAYAEDASDAEHIVLTRSPTDGVPGIEGRFRDTDDGEGLLSEMRAGRAVARPDIAIDPRVADAEQAAHAALPLGATLNVPLVKEGALVAVLAVHFAVPHEFAPEEVALVQEVAERTWEAVGRARAEAALRESEARLSRAFNIQTVGVMFWDEGFRLTDMNDAFLRLTGLTREEALGRTWAELTPPEFHPASLRAAEEVRTGGETTPYEKEFYRKDGSRWWGLFAARQVGNEVVEFVLDVTARKEAEEELRESQERFRAIVETATDYAIFTTDAEGRIVTWPSGAQKVLGWTEDEAVGRPMEMTYTPEDLAAGVPEAERREARSKGQVPNVRWHVRQDGSRVFIDGIARPLTGPDGTLQGFVKVGQDVTERRATEEALRESEARFRQFGDATADVLWIRNAETLEWEYINPAFEDVYGTPRDTILGRNHVRRWAELIIPEDRRVAMDHLRQVREGQHVLNTFRILRGDGEVRWIRDTGFPVRDGQGRVQRVAGIGHDATEEVELQDRLRVLVAELQHRSRNLVTVVQGVTERTIASSQSLEDFRVRIRARISALGRVNSLLSRLEQGDRITFDQLLHTELRAHGVAGAEGEDGQVTLRGPRNIPLPSATVQTFALAIHELTTNALKYGALSRSEGHLEVTWGLVPGKDGGQRLRVDWRETGVPVPTPSAAPARDQIDGRSLTPKQGYGRELIERALPYQLRAETSYELTPEGVRCTIVVPISSKLDVAFSHHAGAEGSDD